MNVKKILPLFPFLILLAGCGSDPAPQPTVQNATAEIPVADTIHEPALDTILANASSQTKALKFQAEVMNDFLMKKDFKSFARYTHPQLITKLGGEQKMITAMENGFKQMDEKGSFISRISVGEPGSVVIKNGELQSVITETVEMKVPEGNMITKSILIAISKDNGKNWYFIDTGNRDLATMQKELPGLSNALVLPKPEGPKMTREVR